jgi:hypothetical protein
VHVAAGDHGYLGGRGGQSVRVGVGVVDAGGVRALNQPKLHLAEAHAGAFVESPIRHNAIRDAGGHGHGGLLNGGAGRAAAVVDLGEEFQLTDTGGPCHGDLGVGVHGERDHAVDVAGGQAGVIEGVEDRLGGQAQLAAPGVLGEVGGADAGDRRLAGEAAGHAAPPIVRVAVATT